MSKSARASSSVDTTGAERFGSDSRTRSTRVHAWHATSSSDMSRTCDDGMQGRSGAPSKDAKRSSESGRLSAEKASGMRSFAASMRALSARTSLACSSVYTDVFCSTLRGTRLGSTSAPSTLCTSGCENTSRMGIAVATDVWSKGGSVSTSGTRS